jgi:uncharacterized membrane protein YfcA
VKFALFIALGIFAAGFIFIWASAVIRTPEKREWPGPLHYGIGLFVNFLDTLGIGSFATMSSCFKIFGLVRDEQIPGTLNVAGTIPGITEAFIYMAVVDVNVTTLTLMIAAAVVGAWLGAGVVSRWPRRKIQIGMGLALLATAGFGFARQIHWFPGGGELLGLTGPKLLIAVLANAVLGALMTLGIGFFAPCMMVIFLLGMNEKTAFPIMMGSVAFLGPVASAPFIRRGSYNFKVSLGLTLGGIPGVLMAAYLVRSLPLDMVRWLVIAVVVYTASMMLRSAALERKRFTSPSEASGRASAPFPPPVHSPHPRDASLPSPDR